MSEKLNSTQKVWDLPPSKNIKEGQLFCILSNCVSYATHTIHKYPSKFIPHVPRWAITKYLGKCGMILDPFCGSGTTLVEGLLHSHDSIGVEIDPLASLISKVKTTPIREEEIFLCVEEMKKKIKSKKKGEFTPKIKNLYHWFSKDAVNQLGIIRDCIEEYSNRKDLYDFLTVTFSSVIRKASNADDQSQKTYVSHTQKKTPKPAIPLFLNNLEKYAGRISELCQQVDSRYKARVFTSDSRNIAEIWRKKDLPLVDLVVTSPPYIKAVDYIYTQMAEYFWVGDLFDLETQKKQNKYKTRYIGTKQVRAREYQSVPVINIKEIDELILKIEKRNRKHAYIVAKFFKDMEHHFREVKNILKKGRHYILVIGNNNVSGYTVPSHKFLAKCAERAGFNYVNYFGYEIRNRYMRFPRSGRGGIIKEDWIIDLKN